MTHATPEEIHDHSYGFRISKHVAECEECGHASEQVGDEREALRDILEEEETPEIPRVLLEPPALRPSVRRRVGPPALVAAALLLAALVWVLRQPSSDRTPSAPSFGSQESDVYRLIDEFKSASPLRRKLAQEALIKYGGTVSEAVHRAKPEQNLIDVIRGEAADDKDLLARMKQTRITLKVDRGVYIDVFRTLETHVGSIRVNLEGTEFATAFITADLENVTVYEALEKICSQMNVSFGVQFGILIVGKRGDLMEFAPLRIPVREDAVARHIGELSSNDAATRDKAFVALRRLGFGAERSLWHALDAASEESRSRAAQLLWGIYGPQEHSEPLPAGWEKSPNVSVDSSDTPLQDVITNILRQWNKSVPLIWNSRNVDPEDHVSFKVSETPADSALRLLLRSREVDCVFGPDCILLGPPGVESLPTPAPQALWLEPVLARGLEALLTELASGGVRWQEKAERHLMELEAKPGLDATTALDALASAAGAFEGQALQRCQRLRRTIAANHRMWIHDLPSGADLQTQTPAQRALLDARVALPASDALTLEELLKRDDVRFAFRTPVSGTYRGTGGSPTRSALLKIVLRPEGLDFYLDGETIVIDTVDRVQEAVEK